MTGYTRTGFILKSFFHAWAYILSVRWAELMGQSREHVCRVEYVSGVESEQCILEVLGGMLKLPSETVPMMRLDVGMLCSLVIRAGRLLRSITRRRFYHPVLFRFRMEVPLEDQLVVVAMHHRRPEKELDIFDTIRNANLRHQGRHFVRHLLDSFTLEHELDNGSKATHQCFVFEPLREPLWIYRGRYVDGIMPFDILTVLLQMILQCLDYLHSECRIIHTGASIHPSLYFEDLLNESWQI